MSIYWFSYFERRLKIASDGSKTRTKSGGGWVIATKEGTIIVRGSNPDYGQIARIHSYRSEVYASLASQLFLKTYAEYFHIIIDNNITGYCDKKAYVERIQQFTADPYLTKGLFKQTEQEAYRILLQIQPEQFKMIHVRGHQDDEKTFDELDTPAQLNIAADKVATTKARKPINTHLLSAPFAIYINERYIPYHFERELRKQHFSEDARIFMMQKYNWNLSIFQSINWPSHDKSINDSRYLQKRFIKHFIHHRLPVGKMNFSAAHRCPFCDTSQHKNAAHDHFLQCDYLRLEKTKWIRTLRTALSKLFTPPNLREAILDRVHNYYDSNLTDTNKINFDENHSYDSRSGSEGRPTPKEGQRRIIEPEDDIPTDDENSNPNQSTGLNTNTKRKILSRIDITSLDSEDTYINYACNGSNDSHISRLIEPFYQDLTNPRQLERRGLTMTTASTTAKKSSGQPIADRELTPIAPDEECIDASLGSCSNSRLLEPFHQNLDIDYASNGSKYNSRIMEPVHQDRNNHQLLNDSTSPRSLHDRSDMKTLSTLTTTIMNQELGEEESGSTIPKQWKLSRMRRQRIKAIRNDEQRNRGTHPATTATQPTTDIIPQSMVITKAAESKTTTISLTPLETKAIKD